MEGKLLNVNRFMSNFATKLVSGFIPVIVYKYAPSNKMFLALLTLIVQYFTNLMFNIALKKYLIKKPQLFLFLRIIPIAIYQILLLFVADYTLFCVIGIGIAFALSYTFKNIPNEVLFAYINASKKRGTGHQLAYAKFIDQLALIAGILIGGIVLDYLDMYILIIVSLSLYLLGSLPLLIYYFMHRKEGKLNQEYSTYAHIALKEQSSDTEYANKASFKVRFIYCVYYFLQESVNAMYLLLPLITFVMTGKFTYSAIAGAIYEGIFGVGCTIALWLDENKDITILSSICGILIGACGIGLIFMNAEIIWLYYILISIMALSHAIIYYFMYHRMLMKSKVVGRNTTCVINKINMNILSTCIVCSFGLFLPISACFIAGSVLSVLSGISVPYVEEKTRRILVDHLEDNEIREDISMFEKLKKED